MSGAVPNRNSTLVSSPSRRMTTRRLLNAGPGRMLFRGNPLRRLSLSAVLNGSENLRQLTLKNRASDWNIGWLCLSYHFQCTLSIPFLQTSAILCKNCVNLQFYAQMCGNIRCFELKILKFRNINSCLEKRVSLLKINAVVSRQIG
jgi:hypothetical protein